jgi:selenocysteine lyase/cysteine desulfurase
MYWRFKGGVQLFTDIYAADISFKYMEHIKIQEIYSLLKVINIKKES